jgi:hypothetical protein
MMAVRAMGLRTGRKLGKGNLTIECQVSWMPSTEKKSVYIHPSFSYLNPGVQSRQFHYSMVK